MLLGILFLSLFAALRDISIGVDTADTIALYFEDQHGRTISLKGITDIINGDIVFVLISNVFHALHLGSKSFLFLLEVLILTPIAVIAYIRREKVPISITMFLYLILYYQIGFNWIRQSIACAFLLLAVVYFQEKKYRNSCLMAVLSILFHSSALIGIALFAYIYTFMRIRKRLFRLLFGGTFLILFFFILLEWETIFSWCIAQGIFPPRYAGYLRVFSGQTTVENWFYVGKRTYVDYLIRILLGAIPFIFSRRKQLFFDTKIIDYYKAATILYLIIYSYVLLEMHSAYANRITYALEYVQILSLGMCYAPSPSRRRCVPVRNIVIIWAAILYNVWLYYILGWHATVPFLFCF